jgi:hypothetical protein
LAAYEHDHVSSSFELAKSDRFMQIKTTGPEPLRGRNNVMPMNMMPASYTPPVHIPGNLAYRNPAYDSFFA